jgi:iron complex outermembrane receptor protein
VQIVNKGLFHFARTASLPSNDRTLPPAFGFAAEKPIHRKAVVRVVISLLLLMGLVVEGRGGSTQQDQKPAKRLTQVALEELGQIEITTTSKEPVKASRTPAAIYVITQQDIRRSGATSIPEALRLAPGVEVGRVDSNTWSIGVRGFGSALSRDVLVLIDGRTVYTPLYAGVYWQVQDTVLEDIERIEVIRGPGGTIWGANAVNAVINIITKSAKGTRGMLVSTGGGKIDQGFVNLRYGGGNDRSFNYRIYGKAFTRGAEFHPNGGRFDNWRMGQTGFRADGDSHNRDSFTLQGDLYSGDAGQSVGITTYSPPYMTSGQQSAELAGGNLLGRWKRILGAGSDLQLQTYYDRTNREQPNFAESRDTFDVDFIHHLPLPGRQDFLWGFGVRLSSGNATEVVPTVVFTPNHLTDKLYSGFIQDEIPIIGHQFSLTIGSKFLQETYSHFELEPTARLLWTPNPRQTVWGAVTRAVRTPSRVEEDLQLTALAAPNPLTFFRVIGDRVFSTEHLLGYEVGYRSLIKPKLNLDIAAFYNNYDHLLSIEPGAPFSETSPAPTHVVFPFFFRNGLLGNTAGFEIAPDWTPTSRWRLRGSYSYLHFDLSKGTGSQDTSTVTSTRGSSPHHQVMIQSSLDLPKKLEFDQTLRYVSDRPAQQVRAYTTADVRFSWNATRSLELSVVGQNLLQPQHAEFGGDPGGLVGIERTVYAKITWQTTQR